MKAIVVRIGKGTLIDKEEIDFDRVLSIDFITNTGAQFSVSHDGDDGIQIHHPGSRAIIVEPHADNAISIKERQYGR